MGSLNFTPNVVYDEATKVLTLTQGTTTHEYGKAAWDIDPVKNWSFIESHLIQTHANEGNSSNGYLDFRLGSFYDALGFTIYHDEIGAMLNVFHNSNLLCNIDIPNFQYDRLQEMEITCMNNSLAFLYEGVWLTDIPLDSSCNLAFPTGWLEATACNYVGTSHTLVDTIYEPYFVVNDITFFNQAVHCEDYQGIKMDMIEDCWWSNISPETTSNMGTLGNVGIGTYEPMIPLHVVGNAFVDGNFSACNIDCETLKVGQLIATGTSLGDSIPIGTISVFYGSILTDASWLLCDGATYNRSSYPELANALGVPASSATFQVPDLRGRFLKGKNADAVGATGGSATKTLTEANMPAHSHSGTVSGRTDIDGSHRHDMSVALHNEWNTTSAANRCATGEGLEYYVSWLTNYAGDHTHTFSADYTTDTKGSGTAFDILPPYTAVNYIIKAKNTTPTPVSEYRESDYWIQQVANNQNNLYHLSGNVSVGIAPQTERLAVAGDVKLLGNVGIGTTPQTDKLLVQGNTQITGNVGIGTTPQTDKLLVQGNTTITGNLTVSGDISGGSLRDATYKTDDGDIYPIYPETQVVGAENIYLWEGVKTNVLDTVREPLNWSGRLKYAVGTTDYSIGNSGLTVAGTTYVSTNYFTTQWNDRYMIGTNYLRQDPAIPEQVGVWNNDLPTNTNRFVINMPVKQGVSHMFFLQVITGDRWSSVSVYIRNKNNTSEVFRCPSMTNSQQGAADGASCMIAPDACHGNVSNRHEWLMFPIPKWVIDTYSSENNLDPLYYAYPKSIRIEVIRGQGHSDGDYLWITGFGIRTNPFNLSITTALPLHFKLNGAEAATWNNASWNEENLIQVNSQGYLYLHVPISTDEKISHLTSISQISDILGHYTLVFITHRSYTAYDIGFKVYIGFRSAGIVSFAMELGRPSPLITGRYGKYFRGQIYRHPMGFVLPKLSKTQALTTQLAFINGQPYLKVVVHALAPRLAYLRGVYLEKTSDIYMRSYSDKWRGDDKNTATKDLYLGFT